MMCGATLSLLYTPRIPGMGMARSDSFFIRAKLTAIQGGAAGFDTFGIDLGSFVDALGKTVLRIHNVSVQYVFGAHLVPALTAATSEAIATWQITTQNQTGMVDADNRTLISSGSLVAANASAIANTFTFVSEAIDVSPQQWTNGYLIAVESIQIAGQASSQFRDPIDISVVLECTVETMTASASMALALSQQ